MATEQTGNQSEPASKPPWEQVWNKVTETITETVTPTPKKALEPRRAPWEREWGGSTRDLNQAPSSPVKQAIIPPTGGIDVSTEAKMKKAAFIADNERMPDTTTKESNLAQIDKEIKRAKDPKVLAILNEERKKYAK